MEHFEIWEVRWSGCRCLILLEGRQRLILQSHFPPSLPPRLSGLFVCHTTINFSTTVSDTYQTYRKFTRGVCLCMCVYAHIRSCMFCVCICSYGSVLYVQQGIHAFMRITISECSYLWVFVYWECIESVSSANFLLSNKFRGKLLLSAIPNEAKIPETIFFNLSS